MLSLDEDEALHVAGSAFQQLSLEDHGSAKEVFAALASRWLTVGKPILARYGHLISNHADDEPQFQQFFEEVPQLLDPLAVLVWPRPDLHGARRPDFVIKRADGSYLIIEIETPAKQLVTSNLQISAAVTQAVTQAMQYRLFLLERFGEANAFFPEFRDPDCLVVIGLERPLSAEQQRALALDNEHRQRVRIVGFDWLAERAERILQNVISANVAVRPLRMI